MKTQYILQCLDGSWWDDCDRLPATKQGKEWALSRCRKRRKTHGGQWRVIKRTETTIPCR